MRTANRNVGWVIKVLGDKPIRQYPSFSAATFRDWLIKQGVSIGTVKRHFASVRAIVNLIITQHGLVFIIAFAKIKFRVDGTINDRLSIPNEDIKKVQALCIQMDDNMRWLNALFEHMKDT